MFGISEFGLLLIVVIVVIGAKKLPDLVRSAGKAARILKSEAKAVKTDNTPTTDQAVPRVIRATPEGVTRQAPEADGSQR